MQVIYHWAFAVAPALCPPRAPTLKSGGARAPWIYGSGASGTDHTPFVTIVFCQVVFNKDLSMIYLLIYLSLAKLQS